MVNAKGCIILEKQGCLGVGRSFGGLHYWLVYSIRIHTYIYNHLNLNAFEYKMLSKRRCSAIIHNQLPLNIETLHIQYTI